MHLLGEDVPANDVARIWVTEGRIVEVEPSGRYTMRGLDAGRHRLSAWHPRLPPTEDHEVDVSLGGVHRLDLQIGVGLSTTEEAPKP